MKLLYSPHSPYARKVRMLAIEVGIADQLVLEIADVMPADAAIIADNPLSKVPTLILDDGWALFDSPVICDYLDTLHDGPRLAANAGPQRWTTARLQAMADGICDAAVSRRQESLRPDGQRSDDWMQRQFRAMARGLDWLEARPLELAASFDVGRIAVMAMLGYLDHRWPGDAWRQGRPQLAEWFAGHAPRRSFQETQPPTA